MIVLSLMTGRDGDLEAGMVGAAAFAIIAFIALGPVYILAWWLRRSGVQEDQTRHSDEIESSSEFPNC
jgi:hypothetical protein